MAADDFLQVKEEDYELILVRCGVTDEMVRESIENVKDWYKMQQHLPEGAVSGERILRVLITTGFSLEKTKQMIDNLLTARVSIPDLMGQHDPCSEAMKTIRQYMEFAVIPQRLDDMTRLTVLSVNGELPKIDMNYYFKMCFMAVEYIASLDTCLGNHYIVDWKEMKLAHISLITPSVIKKSLFITQKCYGLKIKSIHYTNVPPYAELLASVIKASFSDKIGSRLFVHKGYDGLYKYFPKSHLPSDFGGENKSMKNLMDELIAQMVKRREWFLEKDQYRIDESKRIGVNSAVSHELQGLQGSFRSLDVD